MASDSIIQTGKAPRGLSEAALATGLGSIACVILHLLTDIGWVVFLGSIVLGAAGVVFGIIALRKRQPKWMAVTGLVTGAAGFLFMIGMFVFALVFLGVFMAESPYS